MLHHHAAWLLLLARRQDESLEESGKAIELDSTFAFAHLWRGLAYEAKSMHEESIAAVRTTCELTGWQMPFCIGALVHTCATGGRHDEVWVPESLAPDFRIFWPLLGGDSGLFRLA